VLRKGLEAIPPERLWVDPDCGQTRGWPETRASPANLVAAARTVREEPAGS
jgi:5-methyltetrahydropteroyltriglutamate--homocysteine methyltransferase